VVAYSLPEVAVAVAAEAAEDAEAAAVAAVAVAVAAPVAELAASRGATAAFAKSLRRLTDALDKRTSKWPGPTMSTRPFHVCFGAAACALSSAQADAAPMPRPGFQSF